MQPPGEGIRRVTLSIGSLGDTNYDSLIIEIKNPS